MDLLIYAIIIILVVALLVWAIDQVALPHPLHLIARVGIIVIGALLIINRLI